LPSQAELQETLLDAAEDSDPLVRSETAFTMGVVGGAELREHLKKMLSDTYPDARFNAATALARHGDQSAQVVLVEMLDPKASAGIELEKQEESRDVKRAMIMLNGLRAGAQLAEKNRTADLAPLARAVDGLLDAKLTGLLQIDRERQVKVEASQLRDALHKQRAAATSVDSSSTLRTIPAQRLILTQTFCIARR
jgi:hypothetical protein